MKLDIKTLQKVLDNEQVANGYQAAHAYLETATFDEQDRFDSMVFILGLYDALKIVGDKDVVMSAVKTITKSGDVVLASTSFNDDTAAGLGQPKRQDIEPIVSQDAVAVTLCGVAKYGLKYADDKGCWLLPAELHLDKLSAKIQKADAQLQEMYMWQPKSNTMTFTPKANLKP